MDHPIPLASRGLPLAPGPMPSVDPAMNTRGSYRGDAYRAVHPSTPETRTAQAALRAQLYPLPDSRLAALQSCCPSNAGLAG